MAPIASDITSQVGERENDSARCICPFYQRKQMFGGFFFPLNLLQTSVHAYWPKLCLLAIGKVFVKW